MTTSKFVHLHSTVAFKHGAILETFRNTHFRHFPRISRSVIKFPFYCDVTFVFVPQVLTQEDWNTVLYDGMRATSKWAALYFILLMTIGNYILFNLLVAILVEGFANQPVRPSICRIQAAIISTCCFGRRDGLVVSAPDSGEVRIRALAGSLWPGHCVVFLGKTLYSQSSSLHPAGV